MAEKILINSEGAFTEVTLFDLENGRVKAMEIEHTTECPEGVPYAPDIGVHLSDLKTFDITEMQKITGLFEEVDRERQKMPGYVQTYNREDLPQRITDIAQQIMIVANHLQKLRTDHIRVLYETRLYEDRRAMLESELAAWQWRGREAEEAKAAAEAREAEAKKEAERKARLREQAVAEVNRELAARGIKYQCK